MAPSLQAAAQAGKILGACVFERLPVSLSGMRALCRAPACQLPPGRTLDALVANSSRRRAAPQNIPRALPTSEHPARRPHPPLTCSPYLCAPHPPARLTCALSRTCSFHLRGLSNPRPTQLVMPALPAWEVEYEAWQEQTFSKYFKNLPKELIDPKQAGDEATTEGGSRCAARRSAARRGAARHGARHWEERARCGVGWVDRMGRVGRGVEGAGRRTVCPRPSAGGLGRAMAADAGPAGT